MIDRIFLMRPARFHAMRPARCVLRDSIGSAMYWEINHAVMLSFVVLALFWLIFVLISCCFDFCLPLFLFRLVLALFLFVCVLTLFCFDFCLPLF